MADRQPPTPGEIVIMAAGAVMLIFSFFDFAGNTSAWGTGWFPIATLLPLYGVIMGLEIGLTKFANVKLPDSIVGFTREQLHLVLGIMAGLMALAWLIAGTGNKQVGLWFEVIGGLALAAGAFLLQRERHTGAIG